MAMATAAAIARRPNSMKNQPASPSQGLSAPLAMKLRSSRQAAAATHWSCIRSIPWEPR
jgi:hypothetical protein